MISTIAIYFAMGGYAIYVWPAYAVTAAVLGGFTVLSWHRHRDSARSLDRLQQQLRHGR